MGRLRPLELMLTNARLRMAVFAAVGAQTLFWIFTFYYIHARTNPMGDGMEWLAAIPMTFIYFALVVPALIFGVLGIWYALATKIAAVLAVLAIAANAVFWLEIAGEFAYKTTH